MFNKILLRALVLFLPLVLVGCGQQPTTKTVPAAGDENLKTVLIQNFAFNPAELTVAAGTTITWNEVDSAPHTIVADDGSFKSAALTAGQSFRQIFNQPGTYNYHCSIHPSMKGKIIVK